MSTAEALIREQLLGPQMPNLRKVYCGGLFGLSGCLLYLHSAITSSDPFIFMLTVLAFAVAVLSVTVTNRWALILGISFTVFVIGANAQEFLSALMQPASAHLFGLMVLMMTIVIVTIVSGTLSLMPGKHDVSNHWLVIIFLCLAMFNIGASATAFITVHSTPQSTRQSNR